LALLGWAPPGEEEIFSSEELIQLFSLKHVAKNPAVFDIDKLNWINSHYLKKLDRAQLTELALPHLRHAGLIDGELSAEKLAWVQQVVEAVREYVSFAAQIPEHAAVFFRDEVVMDNEETAAILQDPDVPAVMDAFLARIAGLETITGEQVHATLKAIGKELKLGGKKVFMPVRVALTGKMHGPELVAMIPLLGVEQTAARIKRSMALAQKG
jgi:nondiscriminating glutamyl-tRNA synthetase